MVARQWPTINITMITEMDKYLIDKAQSPETKSEGAARGRGWFALPSNSTVL